MLSGRIADEDLQIGQVPVAWAGLISDSLLYRSTANHWQNLELVTRPKPSVMKRNRTV